MTKGFLRAEMKHNEANVALVPGSSSSTPAFLVFQTRPAPRDGGETALSLPRTRIMVTYIMRLPESELEQGLLPQHTKAMNHPNNLLISLIKMACHFLLFLFFPPRLLCLRLPPLRSSSFSFWSSSSRCILFIFHFPPIW